MKFLCGNKFQSMSTLTSLIAVMIAAIFVKEGSCACTSTQFTCRDGFCIPISGRCDHTDNCPDGSDEIGCAIVDYSLVLTLSTTVAQTGSPCFFQFIGNPNVYLSQLQHNQTFNVSYIHQYLDTSNVARYGEFGALEVNYATSYLYFSDAYGPYIRIYVPGALATEPGDILTTSSIDAFLDVVPVSKQVTGLAFDWVSNVLYWSDAGYQRIGALITSTNGYWRIVVDSGLTSPQGIAVYPQLSYLFWSDFGDNPKIVILNLGRNTSNTLVSFPTVQNPTALVFDIVGLRLIWLDTATQQIGSIYSNGSNPIFWTLNLFSRISSFTTQQDFIFLGDGSNPAVYIYNFTSHQYLSQIPLNGVNGIIGMTMYDSAKQPALTSPCPIGIGEIGGCNQFCIATSATTRICDCGVGFFLANDGISCSNEPVEDNFLLVNDMLQKNFFQIDIVTGGDVRAVSISLGLKMTAMDFDPLHNYIYWFDSTNDLIAVTPLDNSFQDIFANVSGTEITSIAIDYVGRMLYYAGSGTIGQMVLSVKPTSTNTILLNEVGSIPMFVALDVYNRFLYWSDCGLANIQNAPLNSVNSYQSVVVVSDLPNCVTTFAIDFQNEIIYWGDSSGVIEFSNLQGAGRQQIYKAPATAAYNGMTLQSNYLYIADGNQRAIQRIDRRTNIISNFTGPLFSYPYNILFYNSSATVTTTTTSTRPTTTTIAASATTPYSSSIRASTAAFTASTAAITASTAAITASTAAIITNMIIIPTSTNSVTSVSETTIILASLICGAIVLTVIIITVGIVCCRKCREKKPPPQPDNTYNQYDQLYGDIGLQQIPTTAPEDAVYQFIRSSKRLTLIPSYGPPAYDKTSEIDNGVYITPPSVNSLSEGVYLN